MASTLLVEKRWLLADALPIIRALQPHVQKLGYHLCLGGSILNTGVSEKDLDLYFLPMTGKTGSVDTANLLTFLRDTWGAPSPMRKRGRPGGGEFEYYVDDDGRRRIRLVEDYPTDAVESCYLHKLKYEWSDLRIDVFILGTAGAAAPTAVKDKPVAATPEAVEPVADGSRLEQAITDTWNMITLTDQGANRMNWADTTNLTNQIGDADNMLARLRHAAAAQQDMRAEEARWAANEMEP